MDKAQFKQRIVGAIVLVALGVIFIPMILNRDDSGPGISDSNLPQKSPELAQLPTQDIPPAPLPPEPPAETRQQVDAATPKLPAGTPPPKADTPAQSSPPAPVAEAKESKTAGWVVQVASFSDRSKALALRDRLRKQKYTAFVESVTSKNATLYRVRVGPVTQKAEAVNLQKKISVGFKIKDTLVMTHP